MNALLHLLATIWDWFAWFLRTLWTGFVALVQTVWGKYLIVVVWCWTVIKYGVELLERLTTMFTDALFSAFDLAVPSGVGTLLSNINYFFPLLELVVMIVAYLNLLLVMIIYRHIKSYVPGAVSGGT